MILAASMGPTPKIWVRVVPEASTCTSVEVGDLPMQRPYVAKHLGGQPLAEAGRGAARGPYAAQEACGPVGRELPGHPAGEEVPEERVQAV
jgi:hypothetical protein